MVSNHWNRLWLIWIWLGTWCLAAEVQVTDKGAARHEQTGIVIASGTAVLPAQGIWFVPDPFGLEGSMTQIFLTPPQDWMQRQQGRRMILARQEEKIKQGRYRLTGVYWILLEYAREHGGVGPTWWEDLPDQDHYGIKNFRESPYASEFEITDPAYALLPDVLFDMTGEPLRVDQNAAPRPLAVELKPYFNDGKHWVLYTNGTVRRVDIDTAWMADNRLKVTPLQERPFLDEAAPSTVVYTVYGLRRPGQNKSLRFQVHNGQTREVLDCIWQPGDTAADPQVIKAWASQRAGAWLGMIQTFDAPVLKQWMAIQQQLYGSQGLAQVLARNRRTQDRQISALGVLGGQAALQETFQLQGLALGQGAQDQTPVPVREIEGVQVKSHPFKEMLGAQPGGRLPLAEVVPADCLFVHFSRPQAVLPFLEKGSGFLSHLGSLAMGRSLDYDLKDRYLARLGLTEALLEQLLQSHFTEEFGLFVPDLFLIDGTDVTIVARVPKIQTLRPLLRLTGLELSQGQIIDIPTTAGARAFWSLDGDLIFISTHRAQLEQALQLCRDQGRGSLGQSDEFRYMLTQLPLTQRTRCYVYVSDPFIRSLVSPATKIAQLRRLKARAHMNLATSAALLYQLDHQSGAPTVERLMGLGYLPKDFARGDVHLEPSLMAVSEAYGPNTQLKTLVERPVTVATAAEARAYKQYVESYSRYWRQYFDPVAVRLDDTEDGGLTLTTFILPLLDSQMYRQIRDWVPGQQGTPLRLPHIKPEPIALLSLNLTDKIWAGMIGQFLRSMVPADTTFVDDLGPALHIAIQDADPVLAFGGGDLLGIAGQMGGMNEMVMIPVIVSLFTRPSAILIETQDPDGLRRFLAQNGLTVLFSSFDSFLQAETYRVTDRDAWVLTLDLFNMAKVRFGVEVQDNYLVITNQPWSQHLTLEGTMPSPLTDLCLHLEPAAARQQLAAMFTSAADKQRQAALQGSAMLAPLVWSGAEDVAGAIARHQALFGFVPRHPAHGSWSVDEIHRVVSTEYGSPGQAQQPAYEAGRQDFGLLQGISPVDVSLQIEDTGLRTRIYWKYREQPVTGSR
ncbi:MAG: hypothetical protein K9N55_16540 [Phycisphaerae bacterium]|nr:hypothetical protein [Phycisphaerae bacterium]